MARKNCNFDTKDAFWHAKNVVARNSTVKGEYLAWYCENVTFLAFEKSGMEATVTTRVMSIKKPLIVCDGYFLLCLARQIHDFFCPLARDHAFSGQGDPAVSTIEKKHPE